MNLLKIKNISLLLLICCSFNSSASVIFEKYKDTSEVTIRIEKEIVKKDIQDFKDALQSIENDKSILHMNAVQLNSGGGNLLAGQEIGKLLRARKLNTYVAENDTCASACVDILIAGVMRYPFGDIKIHRPSYSSELNEHDIIENDIEKWKQTSSDYVKLMGVSNMLIDAQQSTPNWQIRTLSENEKSQWHILGTDQLTEETLFTEIAKEKFISRREFIDIYRKNYENCLSNAKEFIMTTFDCAKPLKSNPISIFKYWLLNFLEWLDKNSDKTTFTKTYDQRILDLKYKIKINKLYLRYMKIQEITDDAPDSNNSILKQLKPEVAKNMEAKNEWWASKNSINILLVNDTDQEIKRVTFSLSNLSCNQKGKKYNFSLELIEPLDRYRSVVYSGLLPIDYDKEIGKGERCGTIAAAL